MKRIDIVIDAYVKIVQAFEIMIRCCEVCLCLEREREKMKTLYSSFVGQGNTPHQYMRQYFVFSYLYESLT